MGREHLFGRLGRYWADFLLKQRGFFIDGVIDGLDPFAVRSEPDCAAKVERGVDADADVRGLRYRIDGRVERTEPRPPFFTDTITTRDDDLQPSLERRLLPYCGRSLSAEAGLPPDYGPK